MILSIESMPLSANSYIQLCIVSTEEEAFAEICRYLEINNIFSDTTTVWKESRTDVSGVASTNKIIKMGKDLTFQIHYDNKPDYISLDDILAKDSHYAYSVQRKTDYGYNSLKCFRSNNAYGGVFSSWFPDEYERYMLDRNKREGEVCR